MTQPNAAGPNSGGRPGQMTAVMRAMPVASGPKVLRIGRVQGGRVVEERVIKKRSDVTVGPSEKNTFVIVADGLPASLKLFELKGNEYAIRFLDNMSGRVALQTGPTDLATLRGQSKKGSDGAYEVRLTDDARGKVVIGDHTFLFQFVTPPPVQPRPQLPASVLMSAALGINWNLLITAAFSFLIHFGAVGYQYSDWADKVHDYEADVDFLAESLKTPPPPVEPAAVDADANKEDDNAKEKPKAAKKKVAAKAKSAGKAKGSGKSGSSGKAGAMSDKQGAALLAKLNSMNSALIGSLKGGPATAGVLRNGNVPTGDLSKFADSGAGVKNGGGLNMGGPGGGPVVPGSGSGNGIGRLAGSKASGGGGGIEGKAKKVQGPKASVSGGGGVSAGKVDGAARVIAGMRARARACYQAELNSNPNAKGRVSCTITVGAGGSVSSASCSPAGSVPGTAACVSGIARRLRFSPPEGGAAVVNCSFNFTSH